MPLPDPRGEYLREHWTNRVYPMAAERGLTMRLPPVQARSRRAHETAAFARSRGRFRDVNLAIYRAFFEDGRDIGDLAVLADIVQRAGLDKDDWRRAMDTGAFAEAVRNDLSLAASLGISSVPTVLVGERLEDAEPVVGAVPYEWLEGAIRRALDGDRSYAQARRRFRPQFRVLE